jgi:hypothetical protein
LASALPRPCCLETSFFGALLETCFFAVTFLAMDVPPAPGFLAVVIFRAECGGDPVFFAANFDGLAFAFAATTARFPGFAATPPGLETLTSPRMERPEDPGFGAFTVGRLVGLLRWFVAMGTTLGET